MAAAVSTNPFPDAAETLLMSPRSVLDVSARLVESWESRVESEERIAVAVSLRAFSCWLLAVCNSVLNCEVESASKSLVLFVESVRLDES